MSQNTVGYFVHIYEVRDSHSGEPCLLNFLNGEYFMYFIVCCMSCLLKGLVKALP